jgi:6-phosphogluconolactonase
MLTRRKFLVVFSAALSAFSTALPTFAAPVSAFPALPFRKKKPLPPAPTYVYFGTDTGKGGSKGIYMSRFDPVKGQLTPPVLAATIASPTFLALSTPRSGHRFLYTVNAFNDTTSAATTFSIDPVTGALKKLGEVPVDGNDPVCISIDSTSQTAFVANYDSSLSSFRVMADGTLSPPVDHIDFKDPKKFGALGPNPHQDASHPHSATISPDNRFVLVSDLGTDQITVFLIDSDTGHLSGQKLFTNNRPGSGPRHIVFHPNGRWVYGINELDSTVDRYLWTATRFSDTPQGMLISTNEPIKTIADDFPVAKNSAAEIVISSDGAFLYASNRGEDTLAVFSISEKDGRLIFLQRISCGGKTPVHLAISPTAKWLLCSNHHSNNVTVFRRDAATGKLAGPTQTMPIDSPMFLLFA